jgi:hypothetical protein
MTREDFWKLIDNAVGPADFGEAVNHEVLRESLVALKRPELLEFAGHMHGAVEGAFTTEMWGAAYLINGGCTEEEFIYFRGWVIGQGSRAYSDAVKNPDTLADSVDPDADAHEDADILGLAFDVYTENKGNDEGFEFESQSKELSGDEWDFEDEAEMSARFPRLWETMGYGGDDDDGGEDGEDDDV